MLGFHLPTLRIVGPVEIVVLCLKGGDRHEVYPFSQIPSTPETVRTEKCEMN